VNTAKGNWELYNVAKDPAESKNLAAQEPDVLKKLAELAKKARVPQVAGTYSTRERADRDRKPGKANPNE
jgi:hypothetical protein